MIAPLKERIQEDVKDAMRARDKQRLGTLRMVTAAIKQREVDERVELTEADILAVLDKMLKQRRDSYEQFSNAGRTDLADTEAHEIDLIEAYMPEALDASAITELVRAAITACEATSMKDMGKVMAQLRPRLQSRADLGQVSGQVKSLLS